MRNIKRLTRNAKPRGQNEPKERGSSVSTGLDASLRSWWAGARATGNLGCGRGDEGTDYILGVDSTEAWPDFVHVGMLAEIAGRVVGQRIDKGQMGVWFRTMGLKPHKKQIRFRDYRGRVKYTVIRTFYFMRPFQGTP